jgi:hypothetical protein
MEMNTKVFALLCVVMVLVAMTPPAQAGVTVQVTAFGEVEFSQITPPPLGTAGPGDPATMSFTVDSDVFTDSGSFPTRGYAINHASFSLMLGPATVGLQNPFPAGQTPYFVLRDNDPAVDGFFTSLNNVDFPIGLPLDQAGSLGQLASQYQITYTGDKLASLDILGALGTYDFTGLTTFEWAIGDGPFVEAEIVFDHMTISAEQPAIPEPAGLGLLGVALLAAGTVKKRREL